MRSGAGVWGEAAVSGLAPGQGGALTHSPLIQMRSPWRLLRKQRSLLRLT